VYERANSTTFYSSRERPPRLPDCPFVNWPLAERDFERPAIIQSFLYDAIFALIICILSNICYHVRSVRLEWCNADFRLCVGSSLIEPVSSLKREARPMNASELRFLNKRSTLEYQHYRKDLLSFDSYQKALAAPPSGGFEIHDPIVLEAISPDRCTKSICVMLNMVF